MSFQSRCKTWLLKLAVVVAVPALVFTATALPSGAQTNGALIRLAGDFQNSTSMGDPEISTSATPAAAGGGGTVIYTRTLRLPTKTVFINFSGTGDSHDGAGLLMTALITDAFDNTVVCEPFSGQFGGGGDAGPNGWTTLQKMPAYDATQLNCNDGGGGPADCHDNNLFFSCCAQIQADPQGFAHTVDIKLASSDGGTVFYERASINIDAAVDPNRVLCTGVGSPAAD
jgi:hypothetical protein